MPLVQSVQAGILHTCHSALRRIEIWRAAIVVRHVELHHAVVEHELIQVL